MTRILFDATALDAEPSGAKTRLVLLAPALRSAGHDVCVVAAPAFDVTSERAMPGVAVTRTAAPSGVVSRWVSPRALAPIVRERQAEVVVFEALPAPRCDVPTIVVIHDVRRLHGGGATGALAARWLRGAIERAARVHVVSSAVADDLGGRMPGAAGKIDVVPNAVVLRAEDPAPELPARVRRPYIFAAGHSEPRKSWDFVARVARDLEAIGISVVRAGRGAERHGNVTDLGVVDDATRDALFRSAIAVLAPARLEGFGLVPLEALACGAWVVASAIPAHREVLGDAASFFPSSDHAAAIALLRSAAVADAAARATRSAAGRTRAAAFSVARMVAAFERSLYEPAVRR